jgi:hypothetical protein
MISAATDLETLTEQPFDPERAVLGPFLDSISDISAVAPKWERDAAGLLPETTASGVMDQVSPPAKISFLMTAWTPQFPSTTWVMPKSTPIVIKEIASSSVSFLVVIRNLRILRNASRNARSTDDFE